MKIEKKYLILLSLAGLIIAIDQATKLYIHSHFRLGESIPVINDFFSITYVRNRGAAFGILGNSHETFRNIFFLTMPPIAVVIILSILRGVPSSDKLQVFALSSVFSGAIGNYIDRLRFRYVIDFLDFHYKEVYSYPAFNVADMAIVIGVMILFYILFKEWAESRNTEQSTKTT